MNEIKMARLDFLTLKPQAAQYILMTVGFLLVVGFATTSYGYLSFVCAWVLVFISGAVFQVQEKDSLERLYGTLSLRKRDVVAGRFASMCFLFMVALVASLIAFAGFSLFRGAEINGADVLFGITLSFFFYSLFIGLQMPLYFKFGYTKARVSAILLPVGLMAALPLLSFLSLTPIIKEAVIENQMVLMPIFVIIGMVILLLSYKASVVAYRKRG